MVAGPGILETLGCKQVGCCSCGVTGGCKVVAGPGLLGTLGCQKGAEVAGLVSLEATRSLQVHGSWARDTGDPRMQAGRLLQLRFHWREQGGSWARAAGDPRMPEGCCGGCPGSFGGDKVIAGPW